MSKSFLDSHNNIVNQALRGVVRLSPHLALDTKDKIVYRKSLLEPPSAPKVLLLSGGGAGHEPAHCGYIGMGMLDVAVSGNVFASPSASQVLKALRAFPSSQGILIIAKNYTGDVLSFGLAAEKAKAEGLKCKLLMVGDDVSISRQSGIKVGRRGLAGIVLVHKIAGAAATSGEDLESVYKVASSVASNLATTAVSLDRCHVPGRKPDSKETAIGSRELEYGVGIHNEPGVLRAPLQSLPITICQLLKSLLDMEDTTRAFVDFRRGDDVALLINNLGGLSVLELHVILDEAVTQMGSVYGIHPKRIFLGTYVSSVNGSGFSLTLLKLEMWMLPLLDAATNAQSWTPNIRPDHNAQISLAELRPKTNKAELANLWVDPEMFIKVLTEISRGIAEDEPAITYFDTIAGDGDCGETLLAGSKVMEEGVCNGSIDTEDLISGLSTISRLVEGSMGGTSGAIYSIYLNALIYNLDSLVRSSWASQTRLETRKILIAASSRALSKLYNYTRARVGDRTMMDVLIPFIESVVSEPESLGKAVDAAEAGANSTKRMKASFGRATYVDESVFLKGSNAYMSNGDDGGIPDAGALGLLSIFKSILRAIEP